MINCINNYKNYLLESGKSENTIYAYVTDVSLYLKFLSKKKIDVYKSDKLTIMSYIQNLTNLGKSERSINRIVISLRNFYSYLKSEALVQEVPKIEYKSSKN